MQLYRDGQIQGLGVLAIPGGERPKNLDGTMVGDVGFDPLGFSNWLNLNWAREAEIKHGRVAMLAATGMIVQDLTTIPGFEREFNGAAMMKLHNLAVQQVQDDFGIPTGTRRVRYSGFGIPNPSCTAPPTIIHTRVSSPVPPARD